MRAVGSTRCSGQWPVDDTAVSASRHSVRRLVGAAGLVAPADAVSATATGDNAAVAEGAPSGEVERRERQESPSVGGRSLIASLAVTGFPQLYLAGFAFGFSRWGLGFLATYVANELTGSPRIVQLTGAAMWLPMLFAGAAAGALADRVDRRRLLLATIGLLMPVATALGALHLADRLEAWMLFPGMFAVGFSWVVDITARRTLTLDIVGERLIDNAMALEAFSTAVALATGVLVGGAVIDRIGVGAAFLAMAAMLSASWLAVIAVPVDVGRVHAHTGTVSSGELGPSAGGTGDSVSSPVGPPPGATAAAAPVGVREVIRSRPLRSALGVTVLANFFYFSHTPLVPVFAELLDVGPLGAGLLGSAGGVGMMISAVGVAALRPPRGRTYVIGVAVAFAGLVGLARIETVPLAFAAALVGATGFGLFSATQAVVTMTSVPPGMKGRAMGLLSMAIGALPIGMFTLGEIAERLGPRSAVTILVAAGAVGLLAWLARRPEVLGLAADAP